MQIEPLRSALRRAVASNPKLYLPIRNLRRPGTVVSAKTDIVIEGFPRSGNTWMEHVVRCADPSLNIAHHSHARAQVVTSLQRGVPTILMYRHPADAIASLYAHQGGGSIASSLKDFLAFYSGTTKPHPCLIRVSFEDATQRPERVLAALATEFGIGKQTGMNSDQIVHAMDQSALKRRGHRKSSAVPNIDDLQRRALKEEAYHLLAQPAAASLLARCMQLYEELSSDV